MVVLSQIATYLDEKGIDCLIDEYPRKDRYFLRLYNLSRRMFREVVLPELEDMVDVNVLRERYGKTTGERVTISIKGVTDDRPYRIVHIPASDRIPPIQITATSTIRIPRGKGGRIPMEIFPKE